MSSSYSPTLRLELIGNGDQSGTWGDTTNLNLGGLLEAAITGVQSITFADADYTLTAYNGLPDEARNAVLVLNGTNSSPKELIAPAVEKVYIVKNNTSNTVTIKTSAGFGIAIANGSTQIVFCNGTDFFLASGVVAGTGITVSGATVSLANTSVAAGTYSAATITVDAQGRIIAASATTLGTMATQNGNSVNITGGSVGTASLVNNTISGGSINGLTTSTIGTNSVGTKTVSTSAPSGGSDGDIWYKV